MANTFVVCFAAVFVFAFCCHSVSAVCELPMTQYSSESTIMTPEANRFVVFGTTGLAVQGGVTTITSLPNAPPVGFVGSYPVANPVNTGGVTAAALFVNTVDAQDGPFSATVSTQFSGIYARGKAKETIFTVTPTAISGDIGGTRLTAGTYVSQSTIHIGGLTPLQIDAEGDEDAVFIIIAGSTLTTVGSADSSTGNIVLLGGAQACNIFWIVGSSATLGFKTTFYGTIIAAAAVTVGDGASVTGRILSGSAVVLTTATVTRPVCLCNTGVPPVDPGTVPPVIVYAPLETFKEWRASNDEICVLVGENTGCSGCTHGTQGLCNWIAVTEHVDQSLAETVGLPQEVTYPQVTTGSSAYICLSSILAKKLIIRDLARDASTLCPVDAKLEPIIREPLQRATKTFDGRTVSNVPVPPTITVIPLKETATLFSSYHSANHGDFSKPNWPVDRTSRWGSAGALLHSAITKRIDHAEDKYKVATFDCPMINDQDNIDLNFLLVGQVKNENDKFCVDHLLRAYLSTRCTPYGVAVSGVCHSTHAFFEENCISSSRRTVNVRYATYLGYDTLFLSALQDPSQPPQIFRGPFLGMRVLPDNTLFCLNTTFSVPATGRLQKVAGLASDLLAEDTPVWAVPLV